jgi:hypothetical protein
MTLKRQPTIVAALSACLEAFAYAEDLGCDSWNFAIEYPALREIGLSRSDIRWLVGKRLLDCAIETSPADAARRSFRSIPRPTFSRNVCFVLTCLGVEVSRRLRKRASAPDCDSLPSARAPVQAAGASDFKPPLPHWDRDRKLLRIGQVVVKQFKVPATNQEAILAAFEEEAWPPRIDDPLPPHRDQSPKRRLQETIKSLNRNHRHTLIRFIGDGRAMGVRWEFCGSARGVALSAERV